MGSQPLGCDGPATGGTCAVGAGVEVGKRGLESSHIGLGLGEQVDHQRPLEPYGGPLRIVLVVGRRERSGLDDRVPLVTEAGGAGQSPLPLGVQGGSRARAALRAGWRIDQAGSTVATSS
jgi:hypothetical protein